MVTSSVLFKLIEGMYLHNKLLTKESVMKEQTTNKNVIAKGF